MIGAGVGAEESCSGVVGADSMTESIEGKGSHELKCVVCSIFLVL